MLSVLRKGLFCLSRHNQPRGCAVHSLSHYRHARKACGRPHSQCLEFIQAETTQKPLSMTWSESSSWRHWASCR